MLKPTIVEPEGSAGNRPATAGRTAGSPRLMREDTPLADAENFNENVTNPVNVESTRLEIQRLFRETAQLSQSPLAVSEFSSGLLNRLLDALAGSAGRLWLQQGEQAWRRVAQITRADSASFLEELEGIDSEQQSLLLERVLGKEPAIAVAPSAEAPLRLLGRFTVDDRQQGVIEIFQRPGTSEAAQRGYLRFLLQMGELAGDYFRREQLRALQRQQSERLELEQLYLRVHEKLDRQHVAYAVANEGRRLLECDRVSVVLGSSQQYRVLAISGLDTFHSRSENVRTLRELCQAVIRVRQPLWYPEAARNLPPQIESVLQAYLDQSQARSLTVIPLIPTDTTSPNASSAHGTGTLGTGTHGTGPSGGAGRRKAVGLGVREPVGALVCEQLRTAEFDERQRERAEQIACHAAVALGNANEHQGVLLLPLWKSLSAMARPFTPPYFAKTFMVLLVLVGILVGLVVTPADFQIGTQGKLLPADRRDVFSHVSGIISQVHVQHADRVAEGQLLLTMRSTDIAVSLSELEGQRGRMVEQIFAKEQLLLRNSRLSPLAQDQVAGELDELKQSLESIEQRIELAREKASQLYVRSPMEGEVVTWQVADTLQQRPVTMGQVLMSVIDPDGPWELEIYVHERRLGHVLEAWDGSSSASTPLTVRFQLSTHPGQSFEGEVVEVQRLAELRGEHGNSVAVRVAIDREELPQLHNEASVSAQILCGRRPLGFVLFQDVIETLRGAMARIW
jgi:multidrug efflux pump subunit AcrA (membrane-fusion protein)